MPGIDFDDSLFPLVRITNHEGTTDADYETMIRRFDALLERRARFVALVSGTGMALPSASQRKIVAEWLPRVRGRMQEQSLGTALVVPSPLQRGALTALNWIVRPYVPMAPVETLAEALSWCESRLVSAGVAIPPPLARAFRDADRAATGPRG